MNMFDKNSEASFVLNGVFEFIKVWQSGGKSTLKLHSKNGKAWINFDCCLGGPLDQHEKLVPKPKPKSKKKQERDNLRAQLHQQRLQGKNSSGDGSLNLHLSSLSSQNESGMETASSSLGQTASSSSSSPNKDNPNSETRNEKGYVSDSLEEDPAANKSSSDSHFENADILSENSIRNNTHFDVVGSSEVFKTNKENVNLDDDIDVTVSDFHNGLFSSTVDKGNNESSCKDLEVQKVQQTSVSPEPEKIEEASLDRNSDFFDKTLPSFVTKLLQAMDAHPTFAKIKEMDESVSNRVMNDWESDLRQQDAIWQNMFEVNPKTNLFPLCVEYFKRVKQAMNDEEMFNQWLKKMKSKYPHRLAYQRINL